MVTDLTRPIAGAGGGGGKAGGNVTRAAREDPDTIRSVARAKIMAIWGEGEMLGLAASNTPRGQALAANEIGRGLFADKTPIQNSDGSLNFQGVMFGWRNGTGSQTYVPGFEETEAETSVNVLVTKATPVTRTITDSTVDAARVSIRIPALLFQDKTTGDLKGFIVHYQIWLQSNGGGYVEKISRAVTDKFKDPVVFSHRLELVGDPPWDIRVIRFTDDYDKANEVGDVYFHAYTALTDAKLTRPHLALTGIQIDAEQFPRIPQLAARVRGIKIEVPVGYDPVARTYTDPWGGSFTTAWTDNPAWVFYAILTNTRWGFGKWVDKTLIDTGELYLISKHCDELIDDGNGGTEPRYTINVSIQTKAEAWQLLNDIASVFRGMSYWGNGTFYAAQDRAKTPSFILANADVIDGRFEYPGTGRKATHTVASVTWNNPDKFYERDQVYVPYEDAVREFGENRLEVAAFGCTRKSQAIREGLYRIITEINEDRLVTCEVGFDKAFALPGEIFEVHDERKSGKPFGGRVSAATTSSITLDRSVTLETGKTYDLRVVLPDGTLGESSVTNAIPGTYTVITVSPAYSTAPLAESIWILKANDLVPQTFRVLGIKEVAANVYRLMGTKYANGKFAAIESGVTIEDQPTSDFPDHLQVKPPGAVSVTEIPGVFPFQSKHRLEVSWLPSDDEFKSGYRVFWRYENGPWDPLAETSGLFARVDVESFGTYEFRVHTLSFSGRLSGPRFASYTVQRSSTGNLLGNLRLSGLEIDGQGNDTNFHGQDVVFVWRTFSRILPEFGENLTEDVGQLDPAAKHFRIEIIDPDTGVVVREETEITETRYVYTYEKNREDGTLGVPRRTFTIRVYVIDRLNRESPPAELTVTNIPPLLPEKLTIDSLFEHAVITYMANTSDPDYRGLIVFRSTVSGFTPSIGNEVFRGDATEIILSQPTNTTWYYRLAGFDAFTQSNVSDLNLSSEFEVQTLGLDTADYQDLSIVNAKILSLGADKLTAGVILGQQITISGGSGEPGQPPEGCLILSGSDGCIVSGKDNFDDFSEGLFYGRSAGGVGFHIGNANTFFRYSTDFGVIEMKGGQIEMNLAVVLPHIPLGSTVPANYEGGQLNLKGAYQPVGHQGADVMLDTVSGAAAGPSLDDTFRIFRTTASSDTDVWLWANDFGMRLDPHDTLSGPNLGYWIGNRLIVKDRAAAVASPSADVNSLKTAVDALIDRLSVAHGLIATS